MKAFYHHLVLTLTRGNNFQAKSCDQPARLWLVAIFPRALSREKSVTLLGCLSVTEFTMAQ